MKKKKHNGPYPKYTKEFVDGLAIELIDYAESEEIPFLNKFGLDRRIPQQTFTDNKIFKENESWQIAHKLAKGWLEYRLVMKGLAKKSNPAMEIFALKNVAGWRDRVSDIQKTDDLSKEDLEIYKKNGDRPSQYSQFLRN